MNKISMDALNAGWAIGFGTRIKQQSEDLDYKFGSDHHVADAPQAKALWPVFTADPAMAMAILHALAMLGRPLRGRGQ